MNIESLLDDAFDEVLDVAFTFLAATFDFEATFDLVSAFDLLCAFDADFFAEAFFAGLDFFLALATFSHLLFVILFIHNVPLRASFLNAAFE